MPPPAPPVALKDHCSVVHDNVLYVYSPDALQSLPLEKDASWSQEPMGISVTGARCVLGGLDGDRSRPALYVIGGSTNSSSIQYPGLQRYSIQDKKWDNVTPVTPVTQNRKHHGAAFLNASSSILVYAGSQDGDSNPSTQTFVIETWPPYNVRSFNSIAPPVVDPIMLTWGENRAAMVGGSPTNTQVFTFGPDNGWADAGVALTKPLPDRSVAQSALLSLVDESKVLITFDMSQSPNVVTRTVVLNPGSQQAPYGLTVGDNDEASRLQTRDDVLLSTFPQYNDSLAPETIRTGASLAQGPDGMVVITGGNDQDPLSIFNALENQWVDTTELLGEGEDSQVPISPSTTSVPTPTGIPSPTATATGVGSASQSLTILGAVLGSICGVAAILIIALLMLRWRKRKNQHSDYANDKREQGGRMSFEDQGRQPIRTAAQPMGLSIAPSSGDMTYFGGKDGHTRQSSSKSSRSKYDPQGSSNINSGAAMFSQAKGPNGIPQPTVHEEPAELQERPSTSANRAPQNALALHPTGLGRKKDSGWSTYFSGNTAVDITDNRGTMESRASHTSSESRGSYWANTTAPVTQIRTANLGLTDSHGNQLAKMSVHTGSPSIGHTSSNIGGYGVAVTEGIPGKISHTDSVAMSMTDDYDPRNTVDNDNGVESAYPSSQPVDDYSWAFDENSWSGVPPLVPRPPSSTYTNSLYPPNVSSPRTEKWSKSSIRPVTQWPDDTLVFPAAPSSRPGTSRVSNVHAPPANPGREARDFFGYNEGARQSQDDMSWLNLNSNNNPPTKSGGSGSN